MTTKDVLVECPKDKGYQHTNQLAWFIGRTSPIHDEMSVLAQRMTSVFQGVPDVWVAVPGIVLPSPASPQTSKGEGEKS